MITGQTTPPVFDASVILAIILQEPGYEQLVDREIDVVASAVNIAEARSKLHDGGLQREAVDEALLYVNVRTVDFDAEQARLSSDLRPLTKKAGLSLGDRACLALAMQHNAVVYTADRAWAGVELPVEVRFIR